MFVCPHDCKYCNSKYIFLKESEWKKQCFYQLGYNMLYINKLNNNSLYESNILREYIEYEYVFFQRYVDSFVNINNKELQYLVDTCFNSNVKRLILKTKSVLDIDKFKILSTLNKKRLLIIFVVSCTDKIDKIKSKELIKNVENALDYNLNFAILINPYIHGLSDLTLLYYLYKLNINEISIKGFSYNKNMANWCKKNINQSILKEYINNENKELILGKDYIDEFLKKYNIQIVDLKQKIKTNFSKGLSYEKAKENVDKIIKDNNLLVNEIIYEQSILRRL